MHHSSFFWLRPLLRHLTALSLLIVTEIQPHPHFCPFITPPFNFLSRTAEYLHPWVQIAAPTQTDVIQQFKIKIDSKPAGTICFKLYDDVVRKTTRNFLELCTGQNGYGYAGSTFHRVIPQFMLQGGDFTNHNGTGGKYIYGEKFAYENFTLKHTKKGLLSIAKPTRTPTAPSFFITTVLTDWLDGKHVVFGEVTERMDVVEKVEALGSRSGTTKSKIIISESGTC